ncbi:tyrosine-type recombinase/integrase [Hahella sp. HN01]|uniref:phage integrase n=1 Tax=Hahella sp. HN01 TaxID=2847262 RepID=UPI001C1EA17A|nr:tyrosine-type recombinase/integrase [Hahella sp. HN01]MBU6951022.1 tyrosine-type recombinase/integrase [Hahella sp. HN01]
MAFKKVATGWQVDIRPEGRGGKRVRKTFPKLQQAKQWEAEQKSKAYSGEWKVPTKDKRRLSDLVKTWHDLHGHTLKDGDNRLHALKVLCEKLNNPIAKEFTAEDFLEYRRWRLTQKVKNSNRLVSANTVNHDHMYLSAVFNKLIKFGNWKLENPLKGVSKLRIDERDLTYLEKDQIRALLEALKKSRNPNVLAMSKICLATGARWGEAEKLNAEQIRHNKVHFVGTKNSKSRAVPISEELAVEILSGRAERGRLFRGAGSEEAFERAVKRAGLTLPHGQLTHILRHTFASHYMINDGNILKLKYILGHASLDMTIRYAKLAPAHLADAVSKNPLATL